MSALKRNKHCLSLDSRHLGGKGSKLGNCCDILPVKKTPKTKQKNLNINLIYLWYSIKYSNSGNKKQAIISTHAGI